jgi:Fe-S-cluster containining protein
MNWKERAIKQIEFDCDRCGKCCRQPKVVDVYPNDAARIVKNLRIAPRVLARHHLMIHPARDGRMALKNVNPCEFYESGCSIYLSRPLICRMYPYLAGSTIYCEIDDSPVPDMDDYEVLIKLAKVVNVKISELKNYLIYVGAWKGERFND